MKVSQIENLHYFFYPNTFFLIAIIPVNKIIEDIADTPTIM